MFFHPKKGEIAPTTRLPKRDIIKAIKKLTKLNEADIKRCMDAYEYIISEAICIGYKVPIKGVGIFEPIIHKGHPVGTFYDVSRGQYYTREEPLPDFIKPSFRFTVLFYNCERTRK